MRIIHVKRHTIATDALFVWEALDSCEFITARIEITNIGASSSRFLVENDMFRVRGSNLRSWGCNGNPFGFGPSRDAFEDWVTGGETVYGAFITSIYKDARDLRLEFTQEKQTLFFSLERNE